MHGLSLWSLTQLMSMELARAPAMHGLSLWSLTQLMSMELAGARGLSLCLQTLLGIRENASE